MFFRVRQKWSKVCSRLYFWAWRQVTGSMSKACQEIFLMSSIKILYCSYDILFLFLLFYIIYHKLRSFPKKVSKTIVCKFLVFARIVYPWGFVLIVVIEFASGHSTRVMVSIWGAALYLAIYILIGVWVEIMCEIVKITWFFERIVILNRVGHIFGKLLINRIQIFRNFVTFWRIPTAIWSFTVIFVVLLTCFQNVGIGIFLSKFSEIAFQTRFSFMLYSIVTTYFLHFRNCKFIFFVIVVCCAYSTLLEFN